jgi:hypothetical protein
MNRNKFINQIRAPGGHIQITIMIDTQQQYIKLNIRGEISIRSHRIYYKHISTWRNETREKIINTLEYRNNPKVTERRSNSEMNVYA